MKHFTTPEFLLLPYFLDWNARVLLVSSELLAGVVFEGALYSRAWSIRGRGLFLSASRRAGFRGGDSGGSNPPFGNLATTIHYDIVCSFVVKKAHTQKLIALRIDTLVITCVRL